MHVNVKFSYHNNRIECNLLTMSESRNRFRQHDTARERIPHINNTFSKGMTIASDANI